AGRRKEIAIRLAMGATRGRLVRQLLGESLVLAAVGGAAGLALAWWGVSLLSQLDVLSPDLRFRPSLAVLASSLALTMLTGVLFGLAPAFRATRMTLAETIKESGSARRWWWDRSRSPWRCWWAPAYSSARCAIYRMRTLASSAKTSSWWMPTLPTSVTGGTACARFTISYWNEHGAFLASAPRASPA